MKTRISKARNIVKNVLVHGAQSVLGSIHFTAVVTAMGVEKAEASIVKRAFGQTEEVTIKDRRMQTTKTRQDIVNGYNHLKLMLGDMTNISLDSEEEVVNEAIDHGNA